MDAASSASSAAATAGSYITAGSKEAGARGGGGGGGVGQAWTRGEGEMPRGIKDHLGTKDHGPWTSAVYTAEQQAWRRARSPSP